jgi:lipid-binding SYLF domain-containing protein
VVAGEVDQNYNLSFTATACRGVPDRRIEMTNGVHAFRRWAHVLALVALTVVAASGCAKAKGTTPAEKRNYTLDMREDTLKKLYAQQPDARAEFKNAEGYGVFSNVGLNLFVLASGNGFGVVRDNANGHEVYMKMKEFGVGLGIGAKDFYAVIVFKSPEALKTFVSEGWEWGGDADASGKTGEDQGAAASASANLQKDVEVYMLTEKGFALQATASGTKYWPDEELNGTGKPKS